MAQFLIHEEKREPKRTAPIVYTIRATACVPEFVEFGDCVTAHSPLTSKGRHLEPRDPTMGNARFCGALAHAVEIGNEWRPDPRAGGLRIYR